MTLFPVIDHVVDKKSMASMLGMSLTTFDRIRREARHNGDPMPEITYGRRMVRFQPGRVVRWLEEREGKA